MRIRYSFSSRRTGNIENIRKQKQKIPEMVKEVIRISDIILEVLDARYIEETRNPELEEYILSLNKKIIYILNKADLINPEEMKKGLQIYPYVFISCRKRMGAGKLRERIKIEVKKIKELENKRAQVGVIGYPNTGKSSLINLLVGKASAGTGAAAGFTKGIQKIKLAKNILVLDTPGVVPEKEDSNLHTEDLTKHTKINVRTYDKVKNPEFVLANLMQESPDVFEKFYNINANGDSEKLIEELGRKKGLVLKGNEVDFDRTARIILKDLQDGKIRV